MPFHDLVKKAWLLFWKLKVRRGISAFQEVSNDFSPFKIKWGLPYPNSSVYKKQ